MIMPLQTFRVFVSNFFALLRTQSSSAEIAQLGERQTEDLKVPGSIPGLGTLGRGASLPI